MQKSGYKTSEFWVTVTISLLTLLNSSGVFKFEIPVDTVANIVTIGATYIGGRSAVKAISNFNK